MPGSRANRKLFHDTRSRHYYFRIADYLDNVMVRTNGCLVAGYELKGVTSYFASDEDRGRGKVMLGSLLKALPEQSMRVQVRFEIVEDLGRLLEVYSAQDCGGNEIVRRLDASRLEAWKAKAEAILEKAAFSPLWARACGGLG